MSPDNVKYLRDNHPNLFLRLESIDVGDGWFNLLRATLSTIAWETKNMPSELQSSIHLTQVKEKFGGIRIYFNHTTPYIDGVIALAYTLSNITCEDCGLQGAQRNIKGWICTACDSCYNQKLLKVKL
jgi:hypothetical protein